MLFDTHTHINDESFDADFSEVLARAQQAEVGRMIVVGVDRPTIERVFPIIDQHKFIYGAIGWNPEDAIDMTDADFAMIKRGLTHPGIVALGEIGLDYHWDKSPKSVQHDVFRRQIRLAKDAGLPLIIHSREATEDVARILSEEHAETIGGVMHCYSDDWTWAERFIDLNFYISFGGPVTFKNAQLQRETATKVPIERLLIETDCPFLSPHPFRGKRNEPARVRLVAEKIAELKGLSLEEVAEQTTQNALRCFRIDESSENG
ncbi:TatD family hydrolase [Sporolactobacillus terrae]|uniref:Putative metal-dependent hydrolase YabD n=1 Tax=Sporolactobacillus terrae TaxID=269673 RepID=A0A5K7WSK4_9BACL|nr:TatD family hydrolase [Sporolactobacillus terrae]BBN97347.1 putative metal-dependent hydrolase YabD [Sporolactobacillus terrae]